MNPKHQRGLPSFLACASGQCLVEAFLSRDNCRAVPVEFDAHPLAQGINPFNRIARHHHPARRSFGPGETHRRRLLGDRIDDRHIIRTRLRLERLRERIQRRRCTGCNGCGGVLGVGGRDRLRRGGNGCGCTTVGAQAARPPAAACRSRADHTRDRRPGHKDLRTEREHTRRPPHTRAQTERAQKPAASLVGTNASQPARTTALRINARFMVRLLVKEAANCHTLILSRFARLGMREKQSPHTKSTQIVCHAQGRRQICVGQAGYSASAIRMFKGSAQNLRSAS